jgi:hypothetical protein
MRARALPFLATGSNEGIPGEIRNSVQGIRSAFVGFGSKMPVETVNSDPAVRSEKLSDSQRVVVRLRALGWLQGGVRGQNRQRSPSAPALSCRKVG